MTTCDHLLRCSLRTHWRCSYPDPVSVAAPNTGTARGGCALYFRVAQALPSWSCTHNVFSSFLAFWASTHSPSIIVCQTFSSCSPVYAPPDLGTAGDGSDRFSRGEATGKNPIRARALDRFLHHNKRFTVELTATRAVCTSSTEHSLSIRSLATSLDTV